MHAGIERTKDMAAVAMGRPGRQADESAQVRQKRQSVRHERKVGAHMGQLSARQNALQTGGSQHDP